LTSTKLYKYTARNWALPGFTEIGEGVRDAGALLVAVSSLHTKMRDDTFRNTDYHLKVLSEGGSFPVYGSNRSPQYSG